MEGSKLLQHSGFTLLRFFDQFSDDLIHGDAFGFGVEGGNEAVAESWRGERFDVVGGDVGAALEEGAHFTSKDEHLAGTRAGTPTEHAFDVFTGTVFVWPGGANKFEDEVDDVIRHGNFAGELLGGVEFLGGDDGFDFLRLTTGGAGDDFAFVGERGVFDFDEEEEAVFLRLGKGVSAFLLDGVHRGEDKERLGQFVSDLSDSDVLFLHRFEQGGLRFGRRAVDFVSEDDLREDGTLLEDKFATASLGVFLNDLGAGDVGRHQIGCELDAAEGKVHRIGEGFDEQSFGEARNTFEQTMTTSGDGDEDLFNHGLLSHDASAEGSFEFIIT